MPAMKHARQSRKTNSSLTRQNRVREKGRYILAKLRWKETESGTKKSVSIAHDLGKQIKLSVGSLDFLMARLQIFGPLDTQPRRIYREIANTRRPKHDQVCSSAVARPPQFAKDEPRVCQVRCRPDILHRARYYTNVARFVSSPGDNHSFVASFQRICAPSLVAVMTHSGRRAGISA